jgi:hypothetical protein
MDSAAANDGAAASACAKFCQSHFHRHKRTLFLAVLRAVLVLQ